MFIMSELCLVSMATTPSSSASVMGGLEKTDFDFGSQGSVQFDVTKRSVITNLGAAT